MAKRADLLEFLDNNIDENLEIVVIKEWKNCLKKTPLITIKEMELRCQYNRKMPGLALKLAREENQTYSRLVASCKS